MKKVTLIDTIRAVHLYGFATRHCGKTVRRWVFDQMFRTGKWDFDDKSPELIRAIEDYSSGGSILLLGCGNASIARHLKRGAFEYLLGIDISPEAISMATRLADERVHFEIGDMQNYRCTRKFDVILLAESIYYIKADERASMLKRFCRELTPSGCIIVTLGNPNGTEGNPSGCHEIIQMIRESFKVLRELHFKGKDRLLLSFR